MSIIGVYLAAGNSKRFGENKLIQDVEGIPLGSMALKTALKSDLDKIVVVTKKADPLEWIPKDLFRERIIHTSYSEGSGSQSDSLKCGVHTAIKQQAKAVLIMLADQPFISIDLINSLIKTYREMAESGTTIVSSTHEGLSRPPVLFSHNMYKELLKLSGDCGAREIVRSEKWAHKAIFLEVSDSNQFFDVDTQESFQVLLNKF